MTLSYNPSNQTFSVYLNGLEICIVPTEKAQNVEQCVKQPRELRNPTDLQNYVIWVLDVVILCPSANGTFLHKRA